jgi:hypothetical protein
MTGIDTTSKYLDRTSGHTFRFGVATHVPEQSRKATE